MEIAVPDSVPTLLETDDDVVDFLRFARSCDDGGKRTLVFVVDDDVEDDEVLDFCEFAAFSFSSV